MQRGLRMETLKIPNLEAIRRCIKFNEPAYHQLETCLLGFFNYALIYVYVHDSLLPVIVATKGILTSTAVDRCVHKSSHTSAHGTPRQRTQKVHGFNNLSGNNRCGAAQFDTCI